MPLSRLHHLSHRDAVWHPCGRLHGHTQRTAHTIIRDTQRRQLCARHRVIGILVCNITPLDFNGLIATMALRCAPTKGAPLGSPLRFQGGQQCYIGIA
jgi:hypothetical protein